MRSTGPPFCGGQLPAEAPATACPAGVWPALQPVPAGAHPAARGPQRHLHRPGVRQQRLLGGRVSHRQLWVPRNHRPGVGRCALALQLAGGAAGVGGAVHPPSWRMDSQHGQRACRREETPPAASRCLPACRQSTSPTSARRPAATRSPSRACSPARWLTRRGCTRLMASWRVSRAPAGHELLAAA